MKTYHLSNDLLIKNVIYKVLDCFARFNKICSAVEDCITSLEMCALEAAVSSKDGTFTSSDISTSDLRRLLIDLNSIVNDASKSKSVFIKLRSILSQAFSKGREQQALDTWRIDKAILMARSNASLVQTWVSAAKALPFSEEPDVKRIITSIIKITNGCWALLKELNQLIDQLPVDRHISPWQHLPESENEL